MSPAMAAFKDRHIVVTGGTGALGASVVGALLKAGAHCRVPYRHETDAARFPLRGDKAVTLVAAGDLSDEAQVAKLYDEAVPLWASIHIAGGFAPGNVAATDKTALMQQLEGNLVSCFLCCRASIRAMQKTGTGGRIVNIAARPALEWRSGAGMSAYAISKTGVAALTVTLAEEVVGDGILVNAVAPSIMDTPANRAAMPNAAYDAWPKVAEVTATVLVLASPDNTVTRGAIVPVYGKS
jgi:NAD(P)-dependent dehydrogenase (short-subunit alcohol dehydrogenase family)